MPHWTIDLEHNEVRDASGGHARLRRRQFDVLMQLARQHDRLVSKDELIATSWHGLTVSDDALTKCISEIRQALGPMLRQTLRTVPGRGYMLTGWRVAETGLLLAGPQSDRRSARLTAALPAVRDLVGRDDDMVRARRLLAGSRLVTIAGPGGIGKTSLATAVAREVTDSFPDGAYFVALAPLLPGGSVAAAIVAALRISSSGEPLAAVVAELADKRVLLVLDNCEHVIEDAAAVVSRLLTEIPELKVIATSREPLALVEEAVFRLGVLGYPATADGLDAQAALAFPAIQLLADRAARVLDGFVLTDTDVPDAVEICARLDGIPLAIVIASAQLRSMRLEEVAASLDRRLEVLTGGMRDAGERQRTLRAMVKWSVDLLTADERKLFAQIGVFAGPATAEDIASVCRAGDGASAVGLIVSLADKSLLNTHRAETGPTRYGYFETTRHFALELLGEDRSVRRRHATHLAEVLRRAEAELEVFSSDGWREAYRPYVDDLRVALAWSFSTGGDAALAVELAARGATLFEELSLSAERRTWIDRAAALPHEAVDVALLGRIVLWQSLRTGWVVWDDGLAHRAAEMFVRSGEALWEGRARAMAAASDGYAGEAERAWPGFDAAERLLRPFGDTRSLSNMLRYRATILIWQGRPAEAGPLLEEAVRIADAIGYFTGSLRGRDTLGEAAFEEGDMEAAIASAVAVLEAAEAKGSMIDVHAHLTTLATYRLLAGAPAEAAPALRRLLDMDRRLDDAWAARLHIELCGFYLALVGDLQSAAAATTYARAASEAADQKPERTQEVIRERLPALIAPLAPGFIRGAEAQAAGWSLDQAVAFVRDKLAAP